jgi:hypothetical protein
MAQKKFYWLISAALIIGYGWVFFNLLTYKIPDHHGVNVCFLKNATSLPCPSCGITRSVLYFFNGDFTGWFFTNPLGVLMVTLLLITPFFLIYDLTKKKSLLHAKYVQLEQYIIKKYIAIPLIIITLINWIWNIYKEL